MSMLEFTIRCVSWEDPEVLDTHQLEREIRKAGGMSAAEALLLCSRIATLAQANKQLAEEVEAANDVAAEAERSADEAVEEAAETETQLKSAADKVRAVLEMLEDDDNPDVDGAYAALFALLDDELR